MSFLLRSLMLLKKELKSIYSLDRTTKLSPASGFQKNTNSAEYIYADFTINTNNNRLDLQINKGNIKELKNK